MANGVKPRQGNVCASKDFEKIVNEKMRQMEGEMMDIRE